MKILIISPFLPYPLDQGGKIRIFNIIKHLSRSHTVTLAAIVDDVNATATSILEGWCSKVLLFKRPAQLWPDRIAFFTSSAPYNVIRYRSRSMRKALKELHERESFDLVQIEFSMMWQYAELFPHIPVVLDAHNIEHKNVQQIGGLAKSYLWRLLYLIERRRLQAVEERAWRQSTICFTVSNKERDAIANSIGDSAKVVTAANGVDPKRFTFQTRPKCGKKILFLGGMDYMPNLDAATYFLEHIFPLIRRDEPETQVLLVGRELQKLGPLADLPGVERHESVPEVLPWFYEADLLVVPLRQGAGTRIKVLEAMSAGLPVVTTPKGCEGISVTHGEEVLIAEEPADFAAASTQILRSIDARATMAQKARLLVEARYSWESSVKVMNEAYSRITT